MKFIKVDEFRYKTEVSSEDQIKINNILEDLSLGDSKGYVEHLNKQILNQLYARYISAKFFNSKEYISNITNYIVIDAIIGGDVLSVSLGKAEAKKGEVKKLAGVLYMPY